MAKETGNARSREQVDTQHLESMTPELGYVTRLNAASRSVYIAALTIATQRVAVSSEGLQAAGVREQARWLGAGTFRPGSRRSVLKQPRPSRELAWT